jgi:hypothetical protein
LNLNIFLIPTIFKYEYFSYLKKFQTKKHTKEKKKKQKRKTVHTSFLAAMGAPMLRPLRIAAGEAYSIHQWVKHRSPPRISCQKSL